MHNKSALVQVLYVKMRDKFWRQLGFDRANVSISISNDTRGVDFAQSNINKIKARLNILADYR